MGDTDPGPRTVSADGAVRQSPAPSAGIAVEVVHRSELWREALSDDRMLHRAARAAAAAVAPGLSADCEIAVVLTSDDEIRSLNREWRGRDGPTNVLSFPLREPGMAEDAAGPLGDVVLAAETVRREATEMGRTVAQHAAHLVVHGVLHLLGHDHQLDDEAERMEALEVRILETLGVPDPYGAAADATSAW
ncbi:MAG: rRNA maturation RNase YbeY [Methyloligellaceae bacterium]